MGSGQSKALVIGKRGRQACAYVFLHTRVDGGTAESREGTRSGGLASGLSKEEKKLPL